MKLISNFLFFLLLVSTAKAEVMLSLGQELIYERNQEQNYIERKLNSYSIGYGIDQTFYIFDYSYMNVSTGGGSLSVDRKVENYMLWGHWTPGAWTNHILPYLAAGLGGAQESIDTTLLGVIESDRGRINGSLGAGFGARLNISLLWLSTEIRVMYTEKWDPNPNVGWQTRLGFWF